MSSSYASAAASPSGSLSGDVSVEGSGGVSPRSRASCSRRRSAACPPPCGGGGCESLVMVLISLSVPLPVGQDVAAVPWRHSIRAAIADVALIAASATTIHHSAAPLWLSGSQPVTSIQSFQNSVTTASSALATAVPSSNQNRVRTWPMSIPASSGHRRSQQRRLPTVAPRLRSVTRVGLVRNPWRSQKCGRPRAHPAPVRSLVIRPVTSRIRAYHVLDHRERHERSPCLARNLRAVCPSLAGSGRLVGQPARDLHRQHDPERCAAVGARSTRCRLQPGAVDRGQLPAGL